MESPIMKAETHHAPDGEFVHSPWVELGAFASPHHSPPLPEYSGFDYGPSSLMAVDASYGMSTIPPPYTSISLAMPSQSWPSMLTTHSPFHESGMPPTHTRTPVSTSARPPAIRKTSTGGSTPRRTLTDEDRRQMCLYHEENKAAKQTDIGALFGVERSTVSKVLRQKDKYLNPDDGNRSPIKRAKGRVPDIEKALVNWALKYQRQGYPLNDEMIEEKALFFANNCGCPEGIEKVLTASWLEKFKQKNNLLGAKIRKGSSGGRRGVRSGSDSPSRINIDSGGESTGHSPGGPSPRSSTNELGSPLSPTQNQEGTKTDGADGLPEFGHSKSTTLPDTTSPTSTLASDSPFTPTSQSRLPFSGTNTNRPRSQTFHSVPIDPSLLTASELMDIGCKNESHQPSSIGILESPLEMEGDVSVKGINPARILKRNRSDPEIKTNAMQPPSSDAKSSGVSPISENSAPGSPTQDEARRALELVMNYFQQQPSGLPAQEYITIGKLMQRLELAKGHQNALLGTLPSIVEHDDAPRVSKKRSIRNFA